MPHPLQDRIAAVARRARMVLVLFGIGSVVAGGLAVTLLCATVDYLVRFQDPLWRAMLSLSVAGTLLATAWRFLWPAWRQRLAPLQVAAKIERLHPKLADRLTTTVAFLDQPENDASAGSLALRRAVIASTYADVEQLDLAAAIEPKPAVRMAAVAIGIAAVTFFIATLYPSIAAVAASRLLMPWGGPAWPRRNHLVVEGVDARIASNQVVEWKLRDHGGQLPGEVQLFLRSSSPGGESRIDIERYKVADPKLLIIKKPSLATSFEYRFEAGDDTEMAWRAVEVVPPPAVKSLEIEITAPAYTGLPPRKSDRYIQAIEGSTATFRGTTNKPLREAQLLLGEEPPVAAVLGRDARSFTVELPIAKAGRYQLRVVDGEGFTGGNEQASEIFAIPDEPPTVSIEQSSGPLAAAAQAIVPLEIIARDDLALAAVTLHWKRLDTTGGAEPVETTVTLYESQTIPPETLAAAADPSRLPGDRKVLAFDWDLSQLDPPLAEGAELEFSISAADHKPQVTHSEPRRLTVLKPTDLVDRIAGRQSLILALLTRILKRAEASHQQTRQVEGQLSTAKPLAASDLDQLQGAELNHREVEDGLSDRDQGVRVEIDRLLADLKNNRLDDSETVARMKALAVAIDQLMAITAADGTTEPGAVRRVSRHLTDAIKLLQSELRAPDPSAAKTTPGQPTSPAAQPRPQSTAPADFVPELAGIVGQTVGDQEVIIAAIQNMLKDLAEWDDTRRFREELRGILREQEGLADQMTKHLVTTVTKNRSELTDDEAAAGKKIARRQQDLAGELERLMQRMGETAGKWEAKDAESAESVEDALAAARQRALVGQMRSAAKNVDENNVGQAVGQQPDLAAGLQDMLDALSNRPEHDLEKLVQKLADAETQLERMSRDEEGLRKQFQEAERMPPSPDRERELERLGRKQAQLKEEADRLARQLMRLEAQAASRSASQAGKKMEASQESGKQGDGKSAEKLATEAKAALDQAKDEVAKRRREAEADLAFEQLVKIKDTLEQLRTRQDRVVADIQRLESLRDASGQLSAAQETSITQLSATEADVRHETLETAKKLSSAAVFRMVVDGAAEDMRLASDALSSGETGKSAANPAERAARRLGQLLAALDLDSPLESEPGGDEGGAGGQEKPGGQKPPSDGIPSLAQLKMLKLMQEDINLRTRELEEKYGEKGMLAEAERQEYARLSTEQGQVHDLLEQLRSALAEEMAMDPGDEVPLSLPDGVEPGESQPDVKPATPASPAEDSAPAAASAPKTSAGSAETSPPAEPASDEVRTTP